MSSLSLVGGVIVTMDADRTIVPRGTVVIRDGSIEAVVEGEVRDGRMLDCRGRLVIPGLVNIHAHTIESLFRGAGGDMGLLAWIDEVSHPLAAAVDASGARAAARLSGLEMLRSGTTAFLDPEVDPARFDAVAGAVATVGLRAALALGMAEGAGYGRDGGAHAGGAHDGGGVGAHPASEDRERDPGHHGRHHHGAGAAEDETTVERILEHERSAGRVEAWLGPRVLSAVSPRLGPIIRSMATRHAVGITFHCAEVPQDGDAVRSRHGMAAARYAESIGLLGPRSVLTHGVHLEGDDLVTLARTGTHVAHCPTSNAKTGGGIAPVTEMRSLGINVGLGTDGGNSNDTYDMVAEMRMAALMQRAARQDAGAMSAGTALGMATSAGADALAIPAGRLQSGALADVVVVQPRREGAWPTVDPLHALVFGAGHAVESVVVGGDVLLERGRPTSVDPDAILVEAEEASRAALERSGVGERIAHDWWRAARSDVR